MTQKEEKNLREFNSTIAMWTRHFKEHNIVISPRALELSVLIHLEEMRHLAFELTAKEKKNERLIN